MDSPEFSRRRLAVLLAVAGLAPALPAAALDLPGASCLADPTKVQGVTRRLTVQAEINGRGPYPFLVDTGANASVISSELAALLDLPTSGSVSLHGIAGVEQVGTVKIQTIAVGRRVRRDLTVSVLPGRFVQAPGVLGLDWLGGQGLVLDFAPQPDAGGLDRADDRRIYRERAGEGPPQRAAPDPGGGGRRARCWPSSTPVPPPPWATWP